MTKKIMSYFLMVICFVIIVSAQAMAGIRYSKHDFSASNSSGVTGFAGLYKMQDPLTGASKGMIDEVCVFCHTPHGASRSPYYTDNGTSTGNNQYLWNRITPVGAGANNTNYKLYSSPTLSVITINNPTGISLMCLSCHDGVTSIAVSDPMSGTNTLLNAPGSGNPTVVSKTGVADDTKIGELYYDGSWLGSGANIGGLTAPYNGTDPIDLTNDHPVSFDWKTNAPGIWSDAPRQPSSGSLRLFGSNKRMECATCHNVHDNTTYPPFLSMSNAQSAMCFACHDK